MLKIIRTYVHMLSDQQFTMFYVKNTSTEVKNLIFFLEIWNIYFFYKVV